MGKIKEVVISLGHSRRIAEEIELKLNQAGIGNEPEPTLARIVTAETTKKRTTSKNVSEVKSNL